MNDRLSLKELKDALHYDPATGLFTRLKSARSHLVGRPAGCVALQGYNVIRVNGVLYRASRLAWFYMNGVWPVRLIDHIDGCRHNDAFANLREATSRENNSNKAKLAPRSGFKGVYRTPSGSFAARIVVDRRDIHLGTFQSALIAAAAYNAGAVKHFGEFARFNDI